MRIASALRAVWKLAVCRGYVHRAYVSNNIFEVRHGVATWNWFITAVHRPVTISYLPRNKRPSLAGYVTFPRQQLCETSGPGPNRSDTFHTFHSIFNIHRCIPEVRRYPPERLGTCCCANRAFHLLSKSFRSMAHISYRNFRDETRWDFLFTFIRSSRYPWIFLKNINY